ncbi:hypothetical protein O6H91_10G053300 [Diphasiastrum complanatum]|uniref:Uncharacterized protein n=1 Tax=Diphasiastrum complanatum TaxID=34168 RepID=A0ACC2CGZ5_DIPCM|nr:hypothetical protein O6H91_10G053300 [Diphasiastrum complanatum]
MTTNNFLGSTVKTGIPKETSHLLWQRVQKVSNQELCSGSALETPHDSDFQDSNPARSSEESIQVTRHNKNGFVMGPTSSQQNNGHFSRVLLNPEKQVPGHRLSAKSPKSDSRSDGLQKASNKNVSSEVKVDSVASHGQGDYVLDQGSYLKSRARPTANGRGQDTKGLWTRKATWIEGEQGKCDVEDASENSKQQNYLRNSNSTRFSYHELYHNNSESIPQMMESRRPRSAPSTANGSVNGFQEFRREVASVQKMAQEQVFSSKKPSLPDLFTITDLSETPSMDHFSERQVSFDESASQTTGKWKKLGNHPDRNSHKEKAGEKEHGSHHVAQKWVPVDHRSGGPHLESLKLNKARDDGAKHVSTLYDLKDIENVAVYTLNERRSDTNCSENGENISESAGKILSSSRQAMIIDQDHSGGNEFNELKVEVLSLSTARVNNEMKLSVERANFATSDAQPAEPKDYPEKVSPTDEDFSSVARAVIDAVHASLEGRKAAERLAATVGSPIAEFEKVLEAVAPTIETTLEASEIKKAQRVCNLGSNRTKAFAQHGSSNLTYTLYKHLVFRCRVDDIPVSTIWDWYEESGNYGVEVKSLGLQGTDTCHRAQQFSAFFVPYLSGLQLFECTASCCQSPKRELKVNALLNLDKNGGDLLEYGSTELVNNNIFDTLLPKPLVMDEDYPASCPSESQDADKLACRSCCSYSEHSFKNNVNLLFEFYDAEQPQQRITLFQKVQQLIRGEVGLQSQKRGNAALLGSLKLGDLHPASWFSVAWYPIYRIPEGLARDVFLTYHSFGHVLIKKRNCCTPCSIGSPFGISIPVVGLQYYNCQVLF